MSSLFNAQQSIYGLLTADTALMAMVTGVYDYVPEGTAHPYVVLSQAEHTDISAMNRQKCRVESHITVYSREKGAKNLHQIMHRITELVQHVTPTVAGYNALPITVSEVSSSKQVDGLTYKGVMVLHIYLEKS